MNGAARPARPDTLASPVGATGRLGEVVTPSVMIIVARDRPELYEYFRRAFHDIEGVTVISDRRLAAPSTGDLTSDATLCRRQEPDVYDELLLRGFVLKRLP